MNLQYQEIAFSIMLKETITLRNFYYKLSSGLNYCLNYNNKTCDLHKNSSIKCYTFYVKEQLPIQAGHRCTLVLRIMNDCADDMVNALFKRNNDVFVADRIIYGITKTFNKYNKMLAMKTVTPAVLTVSDENSVRYMDVESFDEQTVIEHMNNNLCRKYLQIIGSDERLQHNAVKSVTLLRPDKKSCVSDYKNGIILANKYLILFHPDELSQKLAFVAMGCGILEKNSIGFGCCFANNDYLYEKR